MTQSSSDGSNPSTADSVSSGLIGRIVESWLSSASERGYQIAFCQLLAAEGEEILYIASHGPFEKGKDVVTRAPDNSIRAYQLKSGDIRLADWRGIDKQINNLVELVVNLPQCPPISKHMPFFVTNGRVEDTVLDYIITANLSWQQRGFTHPLKVIEKSLLVNRFVCAHGTYLPKEAGDFQLLLTLLLNDGRAPLDKAAFAEFLEGSISFAEEAKSKSVSRSLSSAVLLTSYILGPLERQRNHWGLFEGWSMMASYILAAATKFALPQELWEPSFNLAMLGANRGLDDVVEECKVRETLVEGDPLVDGFFYGARQLIVAGLLSASTLRSRLLGKERDIEAEKLIVARIREASVWGESAAPFLLIIALGLEQRCFQPSAEKLMIDYLRLLLGCHADGSRGMPDSFTGPEDSVRFINLIGEQETESFQGFSYTCQVIIDYLARRWRRQALATSWESITRLSLASSTPKIPWEWFIWRSNSAVLEHSMAGQPQSWPALLQDATERDTSSLPPLLIKYPVFLLFFLLVFPHRLTPVTFAAVESVLT